MKESENLRREELTKALEVTYPIRDELQKTLIETFNEELLSKVIHLNQIIDEAEYVLKIISTEYDK